MYMYIYIYIYIYTSLYVCLHGMAWHGTAWYVWLYVCMHVCIHICRSASPGSPCCLDAGVLSPEPAEPDSPKARNLT